MNHLAGVLALSLASPVAAQELHLLDADRGAGHVGARGDAALFRGVLWTVDGTVAVPEADGLVQAVSGDARRAAQTWNHEVFTPPSTSVTYQQGGTLDVPTGQLQSYPGISDCVIHFTSHARTEYHPRPFGIDHAGTALFGERYLSATVPGPFGPIQTCQPHGAYLLLDGTDVWRAAPTDSRLHCVSGDGGRFGGSDPADAPVVYQLAGTSLVPLAVDLGAPIEARVDALSDDGSRARVVSASPGGGVWWWSESGGAVPAAAGADGALATRDFSVAFGTDHVWEAETDLLVPTDEFLAAHGIDLFLAGWEIAELGGTDARGRLLAGVAAKEGGGEERSFVAVLPPWRRYGLTVAAPNVLALGTRSGATLGGALRLELADTPGPFAVFVTSTAAASQPLFGGTLLVDPASLLGLTLETPDATGAASSRVPIPPDAAFEGTRLHAQVASPDATQTGGWALSNGLRVVVGD